MSEIAEVDNIQLNQDVTLLPFTFLLGCTITFLIGYFVMKQTRSGPERTTDCYLVLSSYIITMLILGGFISVVFETSTLASIIGVVYVMGFPVIIMLADILAQRSEMKHQTHEE